VQEVASIEQKGKIFSSMSNVRTNRLLQLCLAKMLLVLLARVPVELVKEISNWANDYNLRSNMAHIPHLHVHLEMHSEYES